MDLSEVEKFETPVKTLKLSEAIRIGASLRPQCQTKLFNRGRSCAFGAAYEAVYGTPPGVYGQLGFSDVPENLNKVFPEFYQPKSALLNALGSEVYGRNDRGESREQIADWLESIGY